MPQTSVQDILTMIDTLSESDRDILQQELLQRAQDQWRREAEKARRQAKANGIDQAAIDKAVHKARYGA